MNLPTFADSPMLIWLAALGPLALLALWAIRRRRAAWRRLNRSDLPPRGGEIATWFVVALLFLALARPMGTVTNASTQVNGRDLVLAIDVSRSMGAEDTFPTRLGRAQEIARGILRGFGQNPHDRVGLVAFAGRGVVRSPLTENLGAVDDAIGRLRPGGVQPGGTDLGSALEAALRLFDDDEPDDGRSILVISDGEDHPGAWDQAVTQCTGLRVIVHALAVGDATRGALVPETSISTLRHDEALEHAARATGGAFVAVGTRSVDAQALYRQILEPGARRMRRLMGWTDRVDLYAWLVAPAFILLCWNGAGRLWRARRLVAWSLVLCFISGSPGADGPADEGLMLFRAGRYAEAQTYYQRQRRQHPKRPVLAYNEGEALFAQGKFDEAIAAYQAALPDTTIPLRIKAEYAFANALTALGRLREAVAEFDRCLALPASDAASAAIQRDARVNREFALSLLQANASEGGSASQSDSNRQQPSNDLRDSSTRAGSSPPNSNSGGPNERSASRSSPEASTEETNDSQSPEERLESSLRAIDAAKTGRLEAPETTPRVTQTQLPDW